MNNSQNITENEDFVENEDLPDVPGEKAQKLKQTNPELYRMAQEIYADLIGVRPMGPPPHFQVHD